MTQISDAKIILIGGQYNTNQQLIDFISKVEDIGNVRVEVLKERSHNFITGELNFNLDLYCVPDIMMDMTEDKSREHYKKVTSPPPPWKKK